MKSKLQKLSLVLTWLLVSVISIIILLEGSLRLIGTTSGLVPMLPAEQFEGWKSALKTMIEDRPGSLATFDAQLGWRPRPGLRSDVNIINTLGLRSKVEYSVKPRNGGARISIFGDSFVYGSGVLGHEAFPSIVEENLNTTEVLNFGVPGYGPDQALLRFEIEGSLVDSDLVVLAITTPSLDRILTISRIFRSASPHFITKPRFLLNTNSKIVIVDNPIQSLDDAARYVENPSELLALGGLDYWYEPSIYRDIWLQHSALYRTLVKTWSGINRRYIDADRPLVGFPGLGQFNEQSSAFEILVALMDRFRKGAESMEIPYLILVLPDGYSVKRSLNNEPSIMEPLLRHCDMLGFDCRDATEAFLGHPPSTSEDRWFVDGFHYSAKGNKLVADWFVKQLSGIDY